MLTTRRNHAAHAARTIVPANAPLDAWAVASSLPFVALPATPDSAMTASMLQAAEAAWGTLTEQA